MSSVKSCVEKKSGEVFSLPSSAPVQQALELMRNKRVRSVMVIDDGALAGIVTQGDCAIKVLLRVDAPILGDALWRYVRDPKGVAEAAASQMPIAPSTICSHGHASPGRMARNMPMIAVNTIKATTRGLVSSQ